MARIRTVKPELFRHLELFKLEQELGLPLRIAWVGLFTACDKEGRFKWRPEELKLDVLPFDSVDFSRVLDAFATRGFIIKYAYAGSFYGVIPSFRNHHVINNKEKASNLPSHEDELSQIIDLPTRDQRVSDACLTPLFLSQGEGKGREGKGKEGNGNVHADSRVDVAIVEQRALPDLSPPAQVTRRDASGVEVKEIIGRYCELFKSKYGSNPPITGQDAGIAKRLAKIGRPKLAIYLEAFFMMPDAYIVKARHPLTLFESKLKEISVFAESGKFTTRRQANEQDDMASNLLLLEKIRTNEANKGAQ